MNIETLIAEAPEGPRLPLINEEVKQLSTGNSMSVVSFTTTHVKLKPCYMRSFQVGLSTFWERYSSLNYNH